MPADEAFVPLAVWLRRRDGTAPAAADVVHVAPAEAGTAVPCGASDAPPTEAPSAVSPRSPEDVVVAAAPDETTAALETVLRDVRCFRARLADALEAGIVALMRDLAYAVVGRELRLAPADVAALAGRILADHPAATPIVVRHAPGESIALDVPTLADPALAPGDVVLAFADGEVDARLGVRLAVLLEALG